MKTIIKKLKSKKNMKTTFAGFIILVAIGLLWAGKIDGNLFLTIMGLATSYLGFSAKDDTNNNNTAA